MNSMKKIKTKSELVVRGLLDYLSETNQTKLLPEVTEALKNLFQDKNKKKEIVVVSFVKLSDAQMENFRAVMKKLLGVDLPIVNNVNKKLLGGFTVSVGDWYLDASLQRELINLKRSLLV